MKVMVYKIVNHGTIPSRRLSGRLNNMWVCSTCYGGIFNSTWSGRHDQRRNFETTYVSKLNHKM